MDDLHPESAAYLTGRQQTLASPALPDASAEAQWQQMLGTLCQFVEQVRFSTGSTLRLKGQHYHDAYLLLEGTVGVYHHDPGDPMGVLRRFTGDTIGEIGFLHGTPANADVIALSPLTAFLITDEAIERLQHAAPAAAVWLLQRLAARAEARRSVSITETGLKRGCVGRVEVGLCRNSDHMRRVQQLRYDVYCRELGRSSAYANHKEGLLTDRLDEFAHVFMARRGDEVIGSLRVNFANEGDLGVLESLYGMRRSADHPRSTGICTRFVVHSDWRGSDVALKLIAAATRFGMRQGKRTCYIDAAPELLHYYRAMGFRVTNSCFLHYDNGPAIPMRLDLRRHGRRLGGRFTRLQYVRLYALARALKVIALASGRPTAGLLQRV